MCLFHRGSSGAGADPTLAGCRAWLPSPEALPRPLPSRFASRWEGEVQPSLTRLTRLTRLTSFGTLSQKDTRESEGLGRGRGNASGEGIYTP
jgi:hypothetical protein